MDHIPQVLKDACNFIISDEMSKNKAHLASLLQLIYERHSVSIANYLEKLVEDYTEEYNDRDPGRFGDRGTYDGDYKEETVKIHRKMEGYKYCKNLNSDILNQIRSSADPAIPLHQRTENIRSLTIKQIELAIVTAACFDDIMFRSTF
ncbi:hypothetical protein H8B13_08585 [Hymenobacter sp. BT188]|uniref:hypothetical protein n=1 Tax=Hymenobacter sp. BT188 TaxID=2763504 RepID=UPI001651583D|nr:hypothetical protein [Hymenobacter sp. BT188]MBC6606873.1 hypothetical protein [Hymenobacter sp. BT188]